MIKPLFKDLFYFLCVGMFCLHVCICARCMHGVHGSKEGILYLRTGVMKGQATLNEQKKIKLISCISTNYPEIKLEIKRNYRNYTNTWRLNNLLLNEFIGH